MSGSNTRRDAQSWVLAIDFDGTCVTHEFPDVGRDVGAVPVLKALAEAGHRLVLWTMRSDTELEGRTPLTDAVRWFADNDIPLFGVQRNPEQDEWTTSPKAYAQIYIDDAALGCPLIYRGPGLRQYVDWHEVAIRLTEKGLLSRAWLEQYEAE